MYPYELYLIISLGIISWLAASINLFAPVRFQRILETIMWSCLIGAGVVTLGLGFKVIIGAK